MAEQDKPSNDAARNDAAGGQTKAGYIPRPPSQADVDQVSSQQGMVTDEWGDGTAGPEQRPRPDASKEPADPEALPTKPA